MRAVACSSSSGFSGSGFAGLNGVSTILVLLFGSIALHGCEQSLCQRPQISELFLDVFFAKKTVQIVLMLLISKLSEVSRDISLSTCIDIKENGRDGW